MEQAFLFLIFYLIIYFLEMKPLKQRRAWKAFWFTAVVLVVTLAYRVVISIGGPFESPLNGITQVISKMFY